MDFEKSIQKIEEIAEAMEQGNNSLDENIASYKKGIELIKDCQDYLNKTELMIETLEKSRQNL